MSASRKTRTQVTIYGNHYTIIGNESLQHIEKVAQLVDQKMLEINSMNPTLDTNKLAVLTAVNAVHELLKLKEHAEQLEKELSQLKD